MNALFWPTLASCALAALTPVLNAALAVTYPDLGAVLAAGNDYTVTWATSPVIPNVDLVLRSGNEANLQYEYTIARNVPDSGSYVWHIPDSMSTATGLSIMVHDSRDRTIANYSPYFTVLAASYSVSPASRSRPYPSTSEVYRPTETIKVHISEKHPHRIVDSFHGEAFEASPVKGPVNAIATAGSGEPVEPFQGEVGQSNKTELGSGAQPSSTTATRASTSIPVPINNNANSWGPCLVCSFLAAMIFTL